MQCSNCGKGLRDGAEFCTTCGTKVVADVSCCPSCAEPAEGADHFCLKCGASLAGSASVEEAPTRVLKIGPSLQERFVTWGGNVWGRFVYWVVESWEAIKPALLSTVCIVGILVAMVVLYIVAGEALDLLTYLLGQSGAFLVFVSLFTTLAVLGITGELFKEWWNTFINGVLVLAVQMFAGFVFLMDDWAHQAALAGALILGACLVRRIFGSGRTQVEIQRSIRKAYAEGRETGAREEWEEIAAARAALAQQAAAEEDSVQVAIEADPGDADADDGAFVLPPPFLPYEG